MAIITLKKKSSQKFQVGAQKVIASLINLTLHEYSTGNFYPSDQKTDFFQAALNFFEFLQIKKQ